eukprot:scaffold10248_cov65-Phaeocystis_antarctica.AAC.12
MLTRKAGRRLPRQELALLLSWRYRTRIAEKPPNAAIASERGAGRPCGVFWAVELTGLLRPTYCTAALTRGPRSTLGAARGALNAMPVVAAARLLPLAAGGDGGSGSTMAGWDAAAGAGTYALSGADTGAGTGAGTGAAVSAGSEGGRGGGGGHRACEGGLLQAIPLLARRLRPLHHPTAQLLPGGALVAGELGQRDERGQPSLRRPLALELRVDPLLARGLLLIAPVHRAVRSLLAGAARPPHAVTVLPPRCLGPRAPVHIVAPLLHRLARYAGLGRRARCLLRQSNGRQRRPFKLGWCEGEAVPGLGWRRLGRRRLGRRRLGRR